MNRHRIVTAGERLAIPRCPSGSPTQTRLGSRFVVAIAGQLPGLQTESGDQKSVVGELVGQVLQHDALGTGIQKDHHIAG